MSAIAGMIDWRGGAAGPAVKKALAALALHGRDGEGLWDGGAAALGWRQTIFHAEDYAEQQPLTGGGGRFKLVFDGRLDNREELSRLLALEEARALPDSAYVMAAFEKWGRDCASHLLGDFAFAVWDCELRELHLARDQLGKHVLVYHAADGFFFFASMPSALFTHPAVPREIDEEVFVIDICMKIMPVNRTHYRGILRVPLAHTLLVSRDRMLLNRYWRLEDAPALRFSKDEDYVDAFHELFDEAVRCRLRTIHPVGSHLSGGWDSSSVTATAARLLGLQGQRLKAFTHVPPQGWRPRIAVPGQIADEGPLAAKVAARLANVDHVLVRNTGKWDFEAIDTYAALFERPLRQIHNGVWWDDLHRRARALGIRVMLSGTEGNMTISYNGLNRFAQLLRDGRLLAFAREWYGLKAAGHTNASLIGLATAPFLPVEVWDLVQRAKGRTAAKARAFYFLNPAMVAEYRLDWRTERRAMDAINRQRVGHALMLHRARNEHRAMGGSALAAWDLEIRDPTGDKRIEEFCYAMPDEQYLRNGQTRWLLRRAMKDVLPAELLQNTARGRQSADWHETAAQSLPLLLDEIGKQSRNPVAARLIDLSRIRKCLAAVEAGDRQLSPSLMNEVMLRTIALGRFVRRFQGGEE